MERSEEPAKSGVDAGSKSNTKRNVTQSQIFKFNPTDYGDGKFNKSKVVIASWNVNGVRAVQNKGFLASYFQNYDFDILALNETKIDEASANKEKIQSWIPKEFNQYWNFCTAKKGYSGTAVFSKVKPISVSYGIGQKKHDDEGRCTTLEFEHFFVVATYIPNAMQDLGRLGYRVNEWDKDFRDYINELKTQKHVIWCGDLNVAHNKIDIAHPNNKCAGYTDKERASFTQTLSEGWVDTWRKRNPTEVKYSYWNVKAKARESNKGWRLDYFVVNEALDEAVEDSQILNEVMGSDHCPIHLILDQEKIKPIN